MHLDEDQSMGILRECSRTAHAAQNGTGPAVRFVNPIGCAWSSARRRRAIGTGGG